MKKILVTGGAGFIGSNEDLDYDPKYSFTKEIEKFYNWVITQEVSVDNYEKSLNNGGEKSR